MVLPALIGAAGGIISGLLGSSAQKKANKMNYQIAMKNLEDQKLARAEMLAEAHRQEAQQKLGTTDAYGNRYHYVEGKGWVVDLSPQSKEMQDLYRGEETTQLAQDIPAKRRQMFMNLARQGREENAAGGLLDAFMRNYIEDPSAIINRRNLMSAEGINEAADAQTQMAMRDAVRMGSSNAGTILAALSKQRGSDLRRAFMENQEGALTESRNRYFTEQGNLSNLYNLFATRASGMPDAPYNPRNLEGGANEILGNMRSGQAQTGTNLLTAFGRQTPQLDYQAQPEYGLANTIAQGAQALASGLDYFNAGRGGGGNAYGGYATNRFPAAPSSSSSPRSADYYRQNVGLW